PLSSTFKDALLGGAERASALRGRHTLIQPSRERITAIRAALGSAPTEVATRPEQPGATPPAPPVSPPPAKPDVAAAPPKEAEPPPAATPPEPTRPSPPV